MVLLHSQNVNVDIMTGGSRDCGHRNDGCGSFRFFRHCFVVEVSCGCVRSYRHSCGVNVFVAAVVSTLVVTMIGAFIGRVHRLGIIDGIRVKGESHTDCEFVRTQYVACTKMSTGSTQYTATFYSEFV